MIIDTISIIACVLIVLLTIESIIANPFFRNIRRRDDDDFSVADAESIDELPKLSVIVLANNNFEALDAHLPLLLTQDYAPGYEVIVVGEKGDFHTENVLQQYAHNKHLYATYIPHRSLFMSKQKLAVALGVKAAHNEWIMLVDSTCRPQSDVWLKTMASSMDREANLVIGYSNYCADTKPYCRFDRLRTACYLLRRAHRSTAYRAGGTNIAFRRSEFIAQDGYRGNLQLVNGEYDFIVNKYAHPLSTRVVLDEDAWVREDEPSSRTWHSRNISYAHVRKFLERSSAHRSLFNFDMASMYVNYLLLATMIALASIFGKWIILGVAIAALIATLVIRSMLANKYYRQFEADLKAWKTPFYELAIVWHNLSTKIRYSKADQYDFTTHKL